jgi:hypothetical protein
MWDNMPDQLENQDVHTASIALIGVSSAVTVGAMIM